MKKQLEKQLKILNDYMYEARRCHNYNRMRELQSERSIIISKLKKYEL